MFVITWCRVQNAPFFCCVYCFLLHVALLNRCHHCLCLIVLWICLLSNCCVCWLILRLHCVICVCMLMQLCGCVWYGIVVYMCRYCLCDVYVVVCVVIWLLCCFVWWNVLVGCFVCPLFLYVWLCPDVLCCVWFLVQHVWFVSRVMLFEILVFVLRVFRLCYVVCV